MTEKNETQGGKVTASRGYAVVDLETTGFGHTDRIVEIGVVLLNANLEVEGVWDTLIQPNRDIPNSHVHKVTASQLVHAPVFADVAPYLADLLSGRVLVAHNATFEDRFLTREFEAAGVETNLRHIEWLDTMRLSQRYLGTSNLADSVAAARVENSHAHSALSDARATAELLWVLARSRGAALPRLNSFAARPVQAEKPSTISRHHETSQSSQEQHWLARLAESLPASGAGGSERYRRALAASLVDHALSASEIKQLGDIAFIDGLSIDDINQTHEEFIRQLAVEAWLDGVVTDAERSLLSQLADDLGVSPELVAALLAEPVAGDSSTSFVLSEGDHIAFTGSLDLPREEWERRATMAGLVPGGVTKKTAVVVAANPDSMSGKAARARELMIPIVSEQTFARLVSQLKPLFIGEAPDEDAVMPSEDTTPEGLAGGDIDGRFAWVSQVGVGGDPGALTAETIAALWIEHKAAEPLYRVSPVLSPRYAIDLSRSSSERIAAQWSLRFERMLDATVHDLMDIPGVGAKRLQHLVEAVVLAAIDEDGTADKFDEEPNGFLDTDIYTADDSVEEPLDEIEVVKGWAALAGSPFPGSGERNISALIKACLHELVDVCIHDERSLAIASRRWLGEATLDELGAQFGVTRERIRQLEKQLRNVFDAKSQLSVGTAKLLAERLGPLVRVSAAQEDLPALWLDDPVLERSAEEYFRCMFNAWERDDTWLSTPGFSSTADKVLTENSNDYNVFSPADIAAKLRVDEGDFRAWLAEKPGYIDLPGGAMALARSHQDRAAAVLSVTGEPMTLDEITEVLQMESNVRSMVNQLAVDSRISRVASSTYALAEWGLEDFSTIAQWIGRRVDESKTGSVALSDLIAEAERLRISESSVRAYAASAGFSLSDGVVTRAEDTEEVIEDEPEDSKHLYFRDGAWHLLVTVTSDHLRGSGFPVPRGVAGLYKVGVNDSVAVPSRLGEQYVRVNRLKQSSTSTIKRFLDSLQTTAGERVWLRYGDEFDVLPAPPFDDSLQELELLLSTMGLDPELAATPDKAQEAINVALGLDPGAPRRRSTAIFGHRRQDDLADILREL